MNNKTYPLISAYFVVAGMSFDPNQCTRFFEVNPSEVLTQGTIRAGGRPPVPHSTWSIKLEKRHCTDTNEVLEELLAIIWPKKQNIMDYVNAEKLEVSFVLGIWQSDVSFPLYNVTATTLKKLSFFDGPLLMDVYWSLESKGQHQR